MQYILQTTDAVYCLQIQMLSPLATGEILKQPPQKSKSERTKKTDEFNIPSVESVLPPPREVTSKFTISMLHGKGKGVQHMACCFTVQS